MVIVGLDWFGNNAVRIACLHGATVYAVDKDSATFHSAEEQGAQACFSRIADVPVSVDAVVDFVGSEATIIDSIAAVSAGGTVVVWASKRHL